MPMLFLGSVLLLPEKANAVSCSAGNYPYLSWCHGCVEGCYCKGPGFYQGGGYLNSCDPEHGTMKFGALRKDSGWNDVYTCPKNFPLSPGGAKSESDCYQKCSDGTHLQNQSKSCSAGQYRQKGTNDCKSCPDDGKSVCDTGVSSFKPTCAGASSDEGIRTCDGALIPNANKTQCVEPEKPKGVGCIPGTYLPANSEECAACPAGYKCPGIDENDVIKKQPIDQGIFSCLDENAISKGQSATCTECEKGTTPNEDGTKCEAADNIEVEPGKYLPANSTEPRPCKGTKKYCPGGYYGKGTTDRGIFDCPYGSDANKNKTGCVMDLTKDQMKYGIYGREGDTTSQCWIKTDPEDYKTCIYGTRTKEVSE